ncbi:MAG: ferrochelatase [Rickettsiaceae bacterium]|nr:ferrochelatase [Rickettsiaceae bacterium]
MRTEKVAVILMNLGGPDCLEAVQPFLFNLFYDPAIIRLPNPFRYLIAKLISSTRKKKAENIYSQMGGKSPILEETLMQAEELKTLLKQDDKCEYKVYVAMRYWKSFSGEIMPDVINYQPDQIILVPLYPHFSTTTTASSIKDFMVNLHVHNYEGLVKAIGCYFLDDKFIECHVDLIRETLSKVKDDNYKILFSAHGLPKSIIRDGDPYQWQTEQTVAKIASNLSLSEEQYQITYQSRVGPVKWLEPNTEHVIESLAQKGVNIIVIPISFVSEHSETLVELDIEYKSIADKYGVHYWRVPTLRILKKFISSLANNIQKFARIDSNITSSNKLKRMCPSNFSKCICKNLEEDTTNFEEDTKNFEEFVSSAYNN